MKRILLIMTIVASSGVAIAQQGNWYMGGVVGLASSTSKTAGGFKTTSTDWALAPEVGTFLKDDIQLGVFLGVSGSSDKNDNGDIRKSSSISPTVYVRKFFKLTDNFSTFAGFYANYTSGTTNVYAPFASESTQSGFGLRLGIGVAYALSPRFTAVGQYGLMGYRSINNKVNGSDNGTDSSFDFGVNTVGSSSLSQGNGSGAVFNIGIYYTFKKASE